MGAAHAARSTRAAAWLLQREERRLGAVDRADVWDRRTASPLPGDPSTGTSSTGCAPALEHRGPDSRGSHLRRARRRSASSACAVIDLDTGDQPIYNEDRSVVVVLNGEIYNYRELRARAAGAAATASPPGRHRGRSSTSTRSTAPTACAHLHGMFAFALWDARRQQLLLARDRVGKKPLLYALRDGALSFASEMQALLQDQEIPREVDPDGARPLPGLGYVPGAADRVPRRAQAARRRTRWSCATARSTLRALLAARLRAQARRRPRRGAVRAHPRRRCAPRRAAG